MESAKDLKAIPMTSVDSGKLREVASDVAYYTNQIVNVILVGEPGGNWVLIDAGMPGSAEKIIEIAEERFGVNNPPVAILLTHGHFDHTGSIISLLKHWPVPVYAHKLEFPYLTGSLAYPEPDISVEGGLLAKMAFLYPHEPVDISEVLQMLPEDNSVPGLAEFKWIHVPGHTPGQVAFFRSSDRLLISADTFITVRQDSLYRVMFQKQEVCGPPVYLTTNWDLAFSSVQKLAALAPLTVIAGHGTAMQGEELTNGLNNLINNWNDTALPSHGKWVKEEDFDSDGKHTLTD